MIKIECGTFRVVSEIDTATGQTYATEIDPIKLAINDDGVANSISVRLQCSTDLLKEFISRLGEQFLITMPQPVKFYGQLMSVIILGDRRTELGFTA